ncbi:MAG: PAS domain S-box protein [Symploca sp. SIO2B6]|nr:PAS domain S-box protein [Symploca sp. SIO2B6]
MNPLVNNLSSLLVLYQGEYLIIDRDLIIRESSSGVQKFSDCHQEIVTGRDVRTYFPELVGIEDVILAIIEGNQTSFILKSIGRLTEKSEPLYIDIKLIQSPAHETLDNSLLIFLEDVTEQMILEQKLVQSSNEKSLLLSALSTSKAYIDKVITSMADALLVTTSSGNIKTVNRTAQNLFGYSESELIEQPISIIIADPEFLLAEVQEYLLEQGELLRYIETVCQTKTGEKLEIAFSCSATKTDHEQIQDIIYVGRDITERQRTHKRLAAQHTVTRILSESDSWQVAAPKILQGICENLGWELGQFWELDQHLPIPANQDLEPNVSEVLRCVETWVKPSLSSSQLSNGNKPITFPSSVILSERVWATHSPQWVNDLVKDNLFLDTKSASEKLHTAFGFPILDDVEILGVMTFLGCNVEQPDDNLQRIMAAIGSQLGQFIKRKQAELALRQQQEQTERLLLNILPAEIAKRLKAGADTIAENFTDVTVLFADLVSFTELSAQIAPTEIVEILNLIFSQFDQLAQKYGLEKIKTIGDAYMVVGGLPLPQENHAEAIADMALEMQRAMTRFSETMGKELRIRIGINTGPVVAGVIGIKKFSYDLWGDTVNVASRMESQGLPGKIQVTAATYKRLQAKYLFTQRDAINLKGKGEMKTYFLLGKREDLSG